MDERPYDPYRKMKNSFPQRRQGHDPRLEDTGTIARPKPLKRIKNFFTTRRDSPSNEDDAEDQEASVANFLSHTPQQQQRENPFLTSSGDGDCKTFVGSLVKKSELGNSEMDTSIFRAYSHSNAESAMSLLSSSRSRPRKKR